MKKLLLIILIFSGVSVNAKKFIVEEFFHDPTDITARRNVKTDINGNRCALVRIYTDIVDLSFDSNLGITEKQYQSNNEIWVYISPGEKRLELSAPNFMPLTFNFPVAIENSEVYIMKLTSDEQPIRTVEGKGGITINTVPEGAAVIIDGLPGVNRKTPFDLQEIMALDYKVILSKDRYFALDTMVTVAAEKNSSYMFTLKPKFADIVINSEPEGAVVSINDVEMGRTPLELKGEELGLDHGQHIIQLEHKDCYTMTNTIVVEPNKENQYYFELNQINGTISIRTIPDGANVYVDNRFLGITPIFNNKINKGNKIIDISKEGFTSVRHKLKVGENEQIVLMDTLNVAKTMTINTDPEGAKFLLNGKYMGITPVRIPQILGLIEFTFIKQDYVDQHIQEKITSNNLKYEYDLDLTQYEVTVMSEPDSANIYVRGEFKGVTPCKVFLPNEKTKIRFERTKYIPSFEKMRPGDTDFILTGRLRKRIKESRSVGFSLEKNWNSPKDYTARFDIGNFLLFKVGWKSFEQLVLLNNVPFKGLTNGEVSLSPVIPITRYAELCPFVGIGYEWGLRDSTNFYDNTSAPALSSGFYSYGAYIYLNSITNLNVRIINKFQFYVQIAQTDALEKEVRYNEDYFGLDQVKDVEWNDIFLNRFGLRTSVGIRLRLGGGI